MKREFPLNHLLGALFAFLFSVTSVGGLVTGWELNITSVGWLIFWCGLFSVLSALLLYFKYGWCVLLLLSFRGAFALWQDGALWDQVQSLAYTISLHFHDVYGWQTIGEPLSEEFDLALILLAYLTALSVSFCVSLRKNIVIAVPTVLLPLVLCLITTDTLPDERYLYLLMLGIILLLVTDHVRRSYPEQFAALTLRIVVPTAAALALLFTLSPQEEYVNHAAEIQQKAVEWFQQMKSNAENVVNAGITNSSAAQKLDLRYAGPKSDFSYTVMRVTASYDGNVYLRGRDYDIYSGTAWESSEDRSETFPYGSEIFGTLSIDTNRAHDVLYVPYYSANAAELVGGYADNSENIKEYSYSVARSPVVISPDVSGCTDLPTETYEWASALVEEITDERTGQMKKAQDIADYVRNSASYDLSTSVMNYEYDDFARWFLEESDTGYCVHFATTAAVLLRAADIPARYVEGYLVGCRADEQIKVTNKDAHAWVEYYDSDSDLWRVLEATPSDGTVRGEVSSEESESEETEVRETETAETSPEVSDTGDAPSEQPPAQSSDKPPQNTQNGTSSGNPVGIGGNSGGAAGSEVQKEPFTIPEWVIKLFKTLACIVLALAVIPVQGELRIAYKRKQWNSGTPNKLALVRFKHSRRLAHLTKNKLPAELEELALKAKFSQHTLTPEELDRFEIYRKRVLQEVVQMPWYRKYFLRWVLAVG